jgi:D-alanyl-D-alanine carboxypeptidase
LSTTRRTILQVGATAALSVGAGAAASAPAAAIRRHRPGRGVDDRALQQVLDDMVVAGAVAVQAELRDPAGVWRGTAGVAKLGTDRPVPAHARFRMGSVTKAFVATVVLQLVAERRLCLDEPVERWVPGVLPRGDRITVRHLLQHTSGVTEYMERFYELHPTTADVVRQRFRRWTAGDLLGLVKGSPLLFEPGSEWSYANTNYTVLGLLIRRVTGRDYGAEVIRRIVRPLRLRHTIVPGTRVRIAGPHAHGYLADDQTGQPVDCTLFNPSIAGPAGELVTTAADLGRFIGALMCGRLLPAKLLAQMKDYVPVSDEVGYGLGLLRLHLPGVQELFGHTGYFFGYDTVTMSTEDGRRQLTMSTNPLGEVDLFSGLVSLLTIAFPEAGTRSEARKRPDAGGRSDALRSTSRLPGVDGAGRR